MEMLHAILSIRHTPLSLLHHRLNHRGGLGYPRGFPSVRRGGGGGFVWNLPNLGSGIIIVSP